jgi:hypothetical protein
MGSTRHSHHVEVTTLREGGLSNLQIRISQPCDRWDTALLFGPHSSCVRALTRSIAYRCRCGIVRHSLGIFSGFSYFRFSSYIIYHLGGWSSLLPCIREVQVSNIGLKTGYLDNIFVVPSSFMANAAEIVPKISWWQFPFSSSFIYSFSS